MKKTLPRLGMLLLITVALATTGCGYKGPLTLPTSDTAVSDNSTTTP